MKLVEQSRIYPLNGKVDAKPMKSPMRPRSGQHSLRPPPLGNRCLCGFSIHLLPDTGWLLQLHDRSVAYRLVLFERPCGVEPRAAGAAIGRVDTLQLAALKVAQSTAEPTVAHFDATS